MKDFMKTAIVMANKAKKNDEVPVGCVIVHNNKIISKTYNKKEKNKCGLFHAEMLGIYKASKKIKSWRLDECDMYVTLKPCDMCLNAIKECRIRNVSYLLESNYYNNKNDYNKIIKYNDKKLEKEYEENFKHFFKNKRCK